jgi:hypothetical protein
MRISCLGEPLLQLLTAPSQTSQTPVLFSFYKYVLQDLFDQ